MSTIVIERPAVVSFTKNEIRYVFESNDMSLPKLYLQVELLVKSVATSNVFKSIKKFNLKPNNNGITYLPINEWINTLVRFNLPSPINTVTEATSQRAEFYIKYREINLNNQDPAWITNEDQKIRIGIKGGIEKELFSRNNYFNYQALNKLFYTWQPSRRFIFTSEQAYLSIYANLTGLKFRTTVTKSDGSTASAITNSNVNGEAFWHINTSPSVLNIANIAGGGTVIKYEFAILNNAGDTVLVGPYEYFIEFRPQYAFYDLGYHNSLGGFDSVRIRGDITTSIEREFQVGESGYDINNWNADYKTPEFVHTGIVKRKILKGDIGFVRTADGKMISVQDALTELTVSSGIYIIRANAWIPVLNIQKGGDLRSTADTKFSFPIELELPYSNSVHTPYDTPLQKGTDTEQY